MKKQQIILVVGAVALFGVIYFFGQTVPPSKAQPAAAATARDTTFNIDKILQASRAQLSADQQAKVAVLEGRLGQAPHDSQAEIYQQLASFYRDSAHLLLPYAYYTGEAAKLENSEKSLTFAARFFLESARSQRDDGLKNWMASESKQLFEKALALNPGNDSLKVGLGSCYIYGAVAESPMQGIMMIREVAERDPSNMYAQYMLGVGGLMSGQLDRAIERLNLVISKQPENLEVKLMLAEAHERKGNKHDAVKWYEAVKEQVNNPEIVQEIEQRINSLKK